jgi:hypothetical protein
VALLYGLVAREGVVGIADRYGLYCPGIESLWEQDFPHLSRLALRPTQPRVQWVPEVNHPRRGVNHPSPSIAEIKERVELYLYVYLFFYYFVGTELWGN